MALSVAKIANNSWWQIIFGFLAIEVASIIGYQSVWSSQLVYLLALLVAGYLTYKKTENGIYLLLGELIAGGLGYVLFFRFDGSRLSFRLGLFGILCLIWLVKWFKSRSLNWLKDIQLLPLGIFFFIFLLSIFRGFQNLWPIGAIFSDFNGYLYFGLLGIFLTSQIKTLKLAQILTVGSVVLAIKTVVVLYIFAHGYAVIGDSYAYHLIRDTRVGEIALISEPLYRIFFQSHLYNLLALIFAVLVLLVRQTEFGQLNFFIGAINDSKLAKLLLWLFIWLNLLVLVISQSRSFWLAGAIAIAVLLPLTAIYFRAKPSRIAIWWLIIPALILSTNFVGQVIINNYSTNFLIGRVSGATGSIGVSSRMAQLSPAWEKIKQAPLLGSGFGATIHYRSDDPRIKNSSNPDGWIDAPALEWGYLDLAVKAGVLGLMAYLSFLLILAGQLFRRAINYDLLSAGLLVGLLTLMVVHIFTPYLNHPLGIGYLLVVMSVLKKTA